MIEHKKNFGKEGEKEENKKKQEKSSEQIKGSETAKKEEKASDKEKKDEKQEKIEELTELVKRVQAEFENFRKREEKERKNFVQFCNAELIFNLLPVLDSIDSAEKNSDEKTRKGIELIKKQLTEVLGKYSLREIKAKEKKFDSSFHECMMHESNPEKEDGIILEEFQKGYMLKDKVLRHSKVKINKIEKEAEKNE